MRDATLFGVRGAYRIVDRECIDVLSALRDALDGEELPLLAAKLTGRKIRAQDELDVAGVLHSGATIDEARLRDLVSSKPERFDTYLAIKAALPED